MGARHDLSKAIEYDVVVVGAGNAALCAALSARDHDASVLVLEKAAPSDQGGNCPFTGGGFRTVHAGMEDIQTLVSGLTADEASWLTMAPYTADDFRGHLLEVTRGEVDPELMETLIEQSRPTVEWMRDKGIEWQVPERIRSGTAGAPSKVPNSVGVNASGSGPGLVKMLTAAAARNGIDILYQTEMLSLAQDASGRVSGLTVKDSDGVHEIGAGAVVLACGGFEANAEMRAEHLGKWWERARARGSRHNTGDGHRAALAVGAAPGGQWSGCHATPIDVGAPETGDLKLTRSMVRRSYPLGISVNLAGRRFVDEGEGFPEQTFVRVGRAVLDQEQGTAFQIFDSKGLAVVDPVYGSSTPTEAGSVRELASKIGIDPDALETTVDAFNEEALDGRYSTDRLDGRTTTTLDPPKSNWAIKMESPPFTAFEVTGGITYTYGGLKINRQGQVLNAEDTPIAGLSAAGEIVGGIFYHHSLRGAGLMHGAVFGRLAGAGAARGS